MNPRTPIVITMVWTSFLLLGHWFLPMRSIESRIISPMLFKVRGLLGQSPALHPAIKMFGIDDVTAAKIERTELTLEEWTNTLELLDKSHPRAIIIDGLFSLANVDKTDLNLNIAQRLSKLSTPIFTGLYATRSPVFGRVPIKLDDKAFQLKTYLDQDTPLPGTTEEQLARISIADFKNSVVYGPHPSLQNILNKSGHILYSDDEGSYWPFLRLDGNLTIPQMMLRPFQDVKFVQNHLMVEGSEIYVADDGSSPINYLSPKVMNENVRSIHPLIHITNPNARLSLVKPGDFVYLIPLFHTGSADFKPTPVGLIPGAFSHLSVLNSILIKDQLRYVGAEVLLIMGFAAAVAYFGWWMGPSTLVLTLLATMGFWVVVCFASFAYKGLLMPFFLPEVSIAGVGISLLLQRIYISERKARMIRSALEGVVRPEALLALQRNPEKLSLDARERVVTVVFIDIVGFSLMVENQQPRVAFEGLQLLVASMSNCIHRHGGIVNKTLGDGILCFFGYSLEENKELGNHAEKALLAALEIQATNLPRVIAAEGRKDPVFPLRVGINTSAVFMGNLGAGERLDITVIGNGVNFAKRLEAACTPHAVLVGSTTHDLISIKLGLVKPDKRLIRIKHHDEQVEAWEYDPLSVDPQLRARAERIYDVSAQIHRRIRRWDMESDVKIAVASDYGTGQLVNFWEGGLKFELPSMINRGTLFEAQLDSSDGVLHRQLAKQGLANLKLEVQTVENVGSIFVMHVRLVGLDERQSSILLDLLEQFGPNQTAAAPLRSHG